MSNLPFAAVRVVDGALPGEQRVEIIVDGEPVAQLPASGVRYELEPHKLNVMWIGLHVHAGELRGGERSQVIASA